MPTKMTTVRFPNGEREFQISVRALEIGDTLKRNGDTWVVETITEAEDGSSIVKLRPATSDEKQRAQDD